MSGQMCWLSVSQAKEEKILHLRTNPSEDWRLYKACPQYAVPDYEIPGGSRGWATYQKLIRAGWKLVPSAHLNKRFVLSWYWLAQKKSIKRLELFGLGACIPNS